MRSALRLEWSLFLLAVMFLTRLPVPRDLPFSDDLMIRSVKFYPAVGGLIGVIGGAVLWLAALVLPLPVAVLVSMAATLRATGAFHEDGLADAADGLGGGMDRDAALEIMRDSRIGTYGAVTLGLALALKAAALMSVPAEQGAVMLVAGHCLSRVAIVRVIATTGYARDRGAKFVTPHVTPDGARWAMATGLFALALLVLAFGPGPALAAAAGGGLAMVLFRRFFRRRIGGYTGDCLGATQQLAELGLYLGLLAAL